MADGEQKRRNVAFEKEISDISKNDVRVRVTGTVISKNTESSSIILDDSTGQLTIMLSTEEELANINPGSFIRVIGMVVPYGEGVEQYHLEIFNKWGILLFESHDRNIGWDGYYKDKLVKEGVYVWKVSGVYNNGKDFKKVGTVVVIH